MNTFLVYYCGACFRNGELAEQVEREIHHKVAYLGKVLGIEATPLHPDETELEDDNYVVSFEGEITAQAKAEEEVENQVHDILCNLGQITAVAFKKDRDNLTPKQPLSPS